MPDDAGAGSGGRRRIVLSLALAGIVVAIAAVLAIRFGTTHSSDEVAASPASATPSAPSLVESASSGIPSASPATPSASSVAPSASARPSGASAPALIAMVDGGGALVTMDENGGSKVSYPVPGVSFGFPAWSPDGSRIAAVGNGPHDSSIYVFPVRRGGPGGTPEPFVIYRSAERPPFYLYWSPDSRKVAFLATEAVGISLRIAPADGSAPLDGSSPGAIIRRGAPLYFEWESADQLLLHVGSGSDAFTGEVGLDGAAVAPALPGTGDFRSAGASDDNRYLAYVRAATDPPGEIVVTSHDGASRHELAVFGPTAFEFEPNGHTLASIAAARPVDNGLAFPLGPLRLMDGESGSVRTLLDGSVLAFFWSPDGRTIAALRLAIPGGGPTADMGPLLRAASTARPVAAPTPSPGAEVRLAFVEVSTGVVRSDRAVRLASGSVSEFVPYFDQYALSHRLWSPDSTSILWPLVDESGRTRLVVVPPDGAASRPIADGVTGFWSP